MAELERGANFRLGTASGAMASEDIYTTRGHDSLPLPVALQWLPSEPHRAPGKKLHVPLIFNFFANILSIPDVF